MVDTGRGPESKISFLSENVLQQRGSIVLVLDGIIDGQEESDGKLASHVVRVALHGALADEMAVYIGRVNIEFFHVYNNMSVIWSPVYAEEDEDDSDKISNHSL